MKRFLIYISQAYSIPIGRPLQEEIQGRGYVVKWFCDEANTASYLNEREYVLQSIEAVKQYQPDVVLVATNVVPDFFPGLKVQIFHGFSVGKRAAAKGHFNIRGFFDLYCTHGPSTTVPFKALQEKHKYFDVIETGWSKVDPLFPLQKREKHMPSVMISSTFTRKLSLAHNRDVVAEIERLSHLGKWHFIAVLHPKMEQEIVEHFKSMQHNHFVFYDTTELIPLFLQADVMFSDTTSAITEFVLQHKPVVTFNNKQPLPYMINISMVKQIEGALALAFSRPLEMMAHIDSFISQTHPYNDGCSSQRVIDASLAVLSKDKIKRKPLNLIRRWKIRQKLHYYRLW